MRKKIEQAGNLAKAAINATPPAASAAGRKFAEGVNKILTADKTQELLKTPEGRAKLFTMAATLAGPFATLFLNTTACRSESGCSIDPTSAFITSGLAAGGAAYVLLKNGVFGQKPADRDEQPDSPLQMTDGIAEKNDSLGSRSPLLSPRPL